MKRSEVTLIDYGLGNIKAFVNIYERLNIPISIALTPADIRDSKRIILPGVGSFDWAMNRLTRSGLKDYLDEIINRGNRPILGVCVGMQIMAKCSEEGKANGLGWIDAKVARFNFVEQSFFYPLPHMGWNDVNFSSKSSLFIGLQNAQFYFLHSYFFIPARTNAIAGTTNYGGTFCSAVEQDSLYGVQFHPEKSHQWGIQLLENFARL